MRLEGEIALVTGASRGIGKAIAERLAREGARVVGTATSQAGADGIGAALAEWNGAGRVLDVRQADACEEIFDEVEKSVGKVSILVNSAGVTRDTLLLRMTDEEWAQVLETDLTAVFRLSKAALRNMMRARHGRIVSIGSVVGTMGNSGQANYAAAKAGLIGFSKSLAREIGSRGITVNVVAPGFIETDMTDALPPEAKERLLGQVALQRLGRPEDVASAVVFLASKEAGYVTGETLHVNGGLYMV